jgi:ABC-type phosphate/phosphonate transport system substrate-binding protein
MLARTLFAFALAIGLVAGAGAQPTDLVFSVTEGVTYRATPKDIRDKFEPVAEVIGKALHRNVRLILVPSYADVRAGLAKQEYDLAFIHPGQIPLGEVKAGRYQAVAWTSGYTEYTVSLLAMSKDPFKGVGDIKGRTLVSPDPESITTAMVRAMLRTENLTAQVKLITTRYQDAVPFYIENGFADVGATAANAVVKEWTDKGGKVFAHSRGVPIKQFIASTRLSVEDRDRIRDALLNLAATEPGRRALTASGYKGFVAPNHDVEAASIAWLGL